MGVSIKLREGAYRTIYNNIWVNGANSPCFHVGNADNHDRYFRNITVMSTAHMKPEMDLDFDMGNAFGEIYTLIAPPAQGPWLEEIDHNCFYSDLGEFVARARPRGAAEGRKYSLDEWQALGFDQHSIFADPLFVDPAHGDYRVRPESPALKLGFENFDMSHVGLTQDFRTSGATRPRRLAPTQKAETDASPPPAPPLPHPPRPWGPTAPSWNSLRRHTRPRWFQEAKFGIYTHWGVYSRAGLRDPTRAGRDLVSAQHVL